jgi:hypothetical protein
MHLLQDRNCFHCNAGHHFSRHSAWTHQKKALSSLAQEIFKIKVESPICSIYLSARGAHQTLDMLESNLRLAWRVPNIPQTRPKHVHHLQTTKIMQKLLALSIEYNLWAINVPLRPPADGSQAKNSKIVPWHSSPLAGLWNVHGELHGCHQECCQKVVRITDSMEMPSETEPRKNLGSKMELLLQKKTTKHSISYIRK